MRIPGYVYASVALIAGLPPATAFGAVVVAATPAQGQVAAGGTVLVNCRAEGQPECGMGLGCTTYTVNSISVTVTGGAVTPTVLTGAVGAPCSFDSSKTCSLLQGDASWTTPSAAPGPYSVTCTAAFTKTDSIGNNTPGSTAQSATVTTVAADVLPPVVSPMTGPSQTVVGGISTFEVTATDPNTPPRPLTYAWSATGGTVTQDAANPAAAAWQAPATIGSYDVTATVSNGTSSSSVKKTIGVVLAVYQAELLDLRTPQRIVAGQDGALFVVGKQGTTGQVGLLTKRGEMRGFASIPEAALAITQGEGVLWITTLAGNLFKVDSTTGRLLGQVVLADGPFAKPSGIAYDSSRTTLWVVESDANRVRVIHPDGTTVATIATVNGVALSGPIDAAVDSSGGRVWILTIAQPTGLSGLLHAFDLDGNFIGSFAPYGGAIGQISRGGGVTVAPNGRVYASDSYQGIVQVFAREGTSVGTIGSYGLGVGQLYSPSGLALVSNGDLAVANTPLNRVDRFGTGVPLPQCAGDTDCDGLSDTWENANGLNAAWAGDSLLDSDGDGLNNMEELAHGTNPNNRDTDGDGYTDGQEVATGFDPTNPNDHRPVVAVSGPPETPPGLVRLSADAHNPDPTSGSATCSVQWTQPSGPAVTLRKDDSTGVAVSFIARAPATYAFDAVAVCGTAQSLASRVTVAVRNVPPFADAGRVVVAAPSSSIWLDAWASSDANGDSPLKFTWDQAEGPPTSTTQQGRAIGASPVGEGLYGYQVTVADRAGASSTAEVPVVVTSGGFPTAVAAALPSDTQVGSTVLLDASASIPTNASSFYWEQVAGPGVAISGAAQPVASFVPSTAGRYAFDVRVASGSLRSPPQRVEVFVAESGGSLPTLTASAPSLVAVNAPVALDATVVSGGALEYQWRQVSGPAAGLTYADRASASAVAFAPGFYMFEVSAKEGAAESRPVRVAFEARSGNADIPQARASAPRASAIVGEVVYLDGRNSTSATRYRWTQVAGPWVALDAQAALTTFKPQMAGRYAFELEVDDGKVRSAPARVQVDVLTAEGAN